MGGAIAVNGRRRWPRIGDSMKVVEVWMAVCFGMLVLRGIADSFFYRGIRNPDQKWPLLTGRNWRAMFVRQEVHSIEVKRRVALAALVALLLWFFLGIPFLAALLPQ